ncbi:hypothetical protein T4B_8728 [Trichinella pseudospiralis]|nr:hypothetical protein T4A_2740 [Trichinella pseudospiralis]KRZ20240.1 hypothetical protein T4B_8728 [Trichinella pseudospiralis]KRZ39101.1 hypothetical protein T4C_12787 [Trichinella pseudospiralis]
MDRSDHFRIVRKFEFERLEIFAKLRTCWSVFHTWDIYGNDGGNDLLVNFNDRQKWKTWKLEPRTGDIVLLCEDNQHRSN